MHPQAAAAQQQDDRRQADCNCAVQRESPRERDEPVRIRLEHEEDDPANPAERETRRRGEIAVARRQRARRERGEQLRERSRNQPWQGVRSDPRRHLGKPAGDQLPPEMSEGCGQNGGGDGDGQERDRVGPELRAESPFRLRAREVRDDHHPEGLGPEYEHQIHAVGGQKAVGLLVPAELVREKRACDSGGETQRHI